MKVLVLGGTKFVGRAFVEAALAAGHEATVFHRGETNPHLFAEAQHVHGDRDGGLDALEGHTWDACVDTCGYVPRVVRQSAELLRVALHRYVFVSSISAYADFDAAPVEGAPLSQLADPSIEEITGETYGGLKALCEQAVQETYSDRATVIRPGFVSGRHDPTGRFTYWAKRGSRGGEALAPAPLAARLQVVDARDLATFMLRVIEEDVGGEFNVTAPMPPGSIADVLHAGEASAVSDLTVTVVDDAFLSEQDVSMAELPLWAQPSEYPQLLNADVSRALNAGFTPRSLAEAAVEALDAETVEGVGLTPERESALLDAWHGR